MPGMSWRFVPGDHLDGTLVMSAGPYRRKGTNGKNGRRGCQVDLLIQTRRALLKSHPSLGFVSGARPGMGNDGVELPIAQK